MRRRGDTKQSIKEILGPLQKKYNAAYVKKKNDKQQNTEESYLAELNKTKKNSSVLVKNNTLDLEGIDLYQYKTGMILDLMGSLLTPTPKGSGLFSTTTPTNLSLKNTNLSRLGDGCRLLNIIRNLPRHNLSKLDLSNNNLGTLSVGQLSDVFSALPRPLNELVLTGNFNTLKGKARNTLIEMLAKLPASIKFTVENDLETDIKKYKAALPTEEEQAGHTLS